MKSVMNKRIASILAALAMVFCGAAYADQTGEPATVAQLTKSCDTVVLAKCTAKSSALVVKNIETTYEFEVTESLKGSRRTGSKMTLTVPGGKHPIYALGQMVPQQAHSFSGEEVALFVKEPAPGKKLSAPAGSKLADTPRIVGGWQGKYTMFTDATDKKAKLVRFNLENFGYTHNDATLSKFAAAYTSGEMQAAASGEVGKRMAVVDAEQKAADEDRSVVLQTPSMADVLPPVVTLDEFKQQVSQATK